jgi:putative lipoprotein
VILRSDGAYSSTVGCNMMGGGYEVDGDTVTFRPGPTTLMACVPPFDRLERDLAETLGSAARFDVTGESMSLLDGSGKTLATFRAVYF